MGGAKIKSQHLKKCPTCRPYCLKNEVKKQKGWKK